jgi:hypothetical protein
LNKANDLLINHHPVTEPLTTIATMKTMKTMTKISTEAFNPRVFKVQTVKERSTI